MDGIDQYVDVLRDEIRRPRAEFSGGFVEYFAERYVLDKDHQTSEPSRDQFNRIIYRHKDSFFTRKIEEGYWDQMLDDDDDYDSRLIRL